MMLTGIGIGTFFSLPTVAVQNALAASQLEVGTAAVRYLDQVGATLGIAIVGTVVASGASGDLMSRLPSSAGEKLAFMSALQQGFVAVLVFALLVLVATFFAMRRWWRTKPRRRNMKLRRMLNNHRFGPNLRKTKRFR